jgi:hypothetical protein
MVVKEDSQGYLILNMVVKEDSQGYLISLFKRIYQGIPPWPKKKKAPSSLNFELVYMGWL